MKLKWPLPYFSLSDCWLQTHLISCWWKNKVKIIFFFTRWFLELFKKRIKSENFLMDMDFQAYFKFGAVTRLFTYHTHAFIEGCTFNLFYFFLHTKKNTNFDPRGRPTVPAGSDHYFRTCCPYIRHYVAYVPTFQNLAKQNKVQTKIVIATGGTVGLAEWIIDDTHVLS